MRFHVKYVTWNYLIYSQRLLSVVTVFRRVGHPAYDLSLEHTPEETSLVDAASLRRQVSKKQYCAVLMCDAQIQSTNA